MIKFIGINPEKCRRFTTKGINLSMRNPVAMVPPGLEDEFMARIVQGLRDGKIIEIPEANLEGTQIKNQGKLEELKEEQTDKEFDLDKEYSTDEHGRKKVETYTIVCASDDEEAEVKTVRKGGLISSIIEEEIEDE